MARSSGPRTLRESQAPSNTEPADKQNVPGISREEASIVIELSAGGGQVTFDGWTITETAAGPFRHDPVLVERAVATMTPSLASQLDYRLDELLEHETDQ